MGFTSLLNISLGEDALLFRVIETLQRDFFKYQYGNYFLKLARQGDFFEGKGTSYIAWIKEFENICKMGDFFYDTPFERAVIAIKFLDDHYEILAFGFEKSMRIDVWSNRIEKLVLGKREFDVETVEMVPRWLLHAAFGEISESISRTNGKKAV